MDYFSCVVILGRQTASQGPLRAGQPQQSGEGKVGSTPSKEANGVSLFSTAGCAEPACVCHLQGVSGPSLQDKPEDWSPKGAAKEGGERGSVSPYHQPSETGAAGTLGSRRLGPPSTAHSSSGHISTPRKARSLEHRKLH